MKGADGTEYEVTAYTERPLYEPWKTRALSLPLVRLELDHEADIYEARHMASYLTATEARQLAAELVKLADEIDGKE